MDESGDQTFQQEIKEINPPQEPPPSIFSPLELNQTDIDGDKSKSSMDIIERVKKILGTSVICWSTGFCFIR